MATATPADRVMTAPKTKMATAEPADRAMTAPKTTVATATPADRVMTTPRTFSGLLGAARNAARKGVSQFNMTFGGGTPDLESAPSSAAATPENASATKYTLEGLSREQKKMLGESRAEMEAMMKQTKTLLGAEHIEESHLQIRRAELLYAAGMFTQEMDRMMEDLKEKNRIRGLQSAARYKSKILAALEAVLAEVDEARGVQGTPEDEEVEADNPDAAGPRGDNTGGAAKEVEGERSKKADQCQQVIMALERQAAMMAEMIRDQQEQMEVQEQQQDQELMVLRKRLEELKGVRRKSYRSEEGLGPGAEEAAAMRSQSTANLMTRGRPAEKNSIRTIDPEG